MPVMSDHTMEGFLQLLFKPSPRPIPGQALMWWDAGSPGVGMLISGPIKFQMESYEEDTPPQEYTITFPALLVTHQGRHILEMSAPGEGFPANGHMEPGGPVHMSLRLRTASDLV